MFIHTNKIISLVAILLFAGISAAFGQMEPGVAVKVDIPHSFVVRGKALPAGDYMIRRVDGRDQGYLLEVQNFKDKRAIFVETIAANVYTPYKRSTLFFDKVGDQWFLSDIFVGGDTEGNAIPETRSEKMFIAEAAPTVIGVQSGVE